MKKFVLPVGAGVVVFGVVTAFAASLSVGSDTLGAGDTAVAACQSAAHVTYATSGTDVSAATVTFSGGTTGACNTMTAEVTLTGTGGTLASPVAETGVVGTPTTNVANVDFSADGVSAKDVTGVAVVISG